MPSKSESTDWILVAENLNYSVEDLSGLPIITNSGCEFTPQTTGIIPGGTYNSGQRFETPRIKNIDKVGINNFRVVSGKVRVRLEYHKAGWCTGFDYIFGPTDEAFSICWRNPHHNTPDVKVSMDFLMTSEIVQAEIDYRNE